MQEESVSVLNQLLAITKGVGLLLMLHVLAIAGLWILLYLADLVIYIASGVANSEATYQLYQVWLFTLLMFGLVQWLYVLPVFWWLQQQKTEDSPQSEKADNVTGVAQKRLSQGVLGGAIATSLLNGGYYLMGLP